MQIVESSHDIDALLGVPGETIQRHVEIMVGGLFIGEENLQRSGIQIVPTLVSRVGVLKLCPVLVKHTLVERQASFKLSATSTWREIGQHEDTYRTQTLQYAGPGPP